MLATPRANKMPTTRQRTGNEAGTEGDAEAGAAETAPERPRWFVVNAETDTFTLSDVQEASRRADPTTDPVPRKESYVFKADPAVHRKFLRTEASAKRFINCSVAHYVAHYDNMCNSVQQSRMLWCNAQRVSTQNVPGKRVCYIDFYLAQPNHLGWDPTVGADGAADQGVVGILGQLTHAVQEFEEDHHVDKLATDAVKRAETRTVTEQLQALEDADKAMLSGVGAQAWEDRDLQPYDPSTHDPWYGRDREGKKEDQNKETKTWWWTAPYNESFRKHVPHRTAKDTLSEEANKLRKELSTIVWETGGEEREESARLETLEGRPKNAFERVREALEGAIGHTDAGRPLDVGLLMEPHNPLLNHTTYRGWQDAVTTVGTVVKLELLARDRVKRAIDSIGASFYGSPDLIDENSVLPAPRRGHKLLIAVLYTESPHPCGVCKRAIGFHTYDPAAAKTDESETYLAARMQDVVNACAWV